MTTNQKLHPIDPAGSGSRVSAPKHPILSRGLLMMAGILVAGAGALSASAAGPSAPGDLLISGYYATGIYRYNAQGVSQGIFASSGLSRRTHDLAVSPDGRYFFADYYDVSMRLGIGKYDALTGTLIGPHLAPGTFSHLGGGLEVGSDGTMFISGNLDGTVRTGGISMYKNGVVTLIDNTINDPWALQLSPDGNRLFASSWSDGGVYEYTLNSGIWTKNPVKVISTDRPEGLALNAAGTRLYVVNTYAPGGVEFNTVQEYAISGNSISFLRTLSSTDLSGARHVTVGAADEDIYVTSHKNGQVIRFDDVTGAGSSFLNTALGNETAFGLVFIPVPEPALASLALLATAMLLLRRR